MVPHISQAVQTLLTTILHAPIKEYLKASQVSFSNLENSILTSIYQISNGLGWYIAMAHRTSGLYATTRLLTASKS
jgi:hypothetical protein